MKFFYYFFLLAFPPYAVTSPLQQNDVLLTLNHEIPNSKTTIYANELDANRNLNEVSRTQDYPTHIIRMDHDIKNLMLTCDTVHEQISNIIVKPLIKDEISYTILVNCRFNPETNLAEEFIIHSYLDPISDAGIRYLENYKNENNGKEMFGYPIQIETAKGLVISMNITVGNRKKPERPPLILYRQDRGNLYFKNNYEMKNILFNDINKRFFSNDPALILPFIDKWFFMHANVLYKNILSEANYAELQPERIFIMEKGDEIFVSNLKQHFVHQCSKYENQRCLAESSHVIPK